MARQLKLTATGDLDLVNGRLSVVEGAQAVATSVTTRARMVRGEYFADLRQGLPFFDTILVKNPNTALVKAIFREAIRETDGVAEVLDIDYVFDGVTRRATLTATIQTEDGEDVVLAPVDIQVA